MLRVLQLLFSVLWRTRITCFVPDRLTSSEKRTACSQPTSLTHLPSLCYNNIDLLLTHRSSISNTFISSIVEPNFVCAKQEKSLDTMQELCCHVPHGSFHMIGSRERKHFSLTIELCRLITFSVNTMSFFIIFT